MKYILYILFVALLLVAPHSLQAQNEAGQWTFGVHAGFNTWISDYNQHLVGEGAELMLRYGINNWFSAGVLAGYEELRANQSPMSTYPALTNSYLKLHAIPVSMLGYIHFASGSAINPYIYAGLGAM